MKKIHCNNFIKLYLLILIVLLGFNVQVFADNPPIPPTNEIQAETNKDASKKVQLKAPIHEELTEEEVLKAAEEAKIREELANEQKQLGEAAPLKIEDRDFDPNVNEELTKEVIPDTTNELIKLVSMFAKVMLGVILASVIIYFLLIFTRKYFHPPLPKLSEEDFDIRDLNSPKNTDEALKSFLDRTGE